MKHFTVLKDFHSDELASDYVAGMTYTARDQDTKLLAILPKWIKDKKIREGGPEPKVTGSGTIKEK